MAMVDLVLVPLHIEAHPVWGESRAAGKAPCHALSGGFASWGSSVASGGDIAAPGNALR